MCLCEEGVLSFYSSSIGPHNGDLYSTRGSVALGWRSTSDVVHRDIESCVVVPLVWRTVLFVRHTGPCSESAAHIFVVVRSGSRGSVTQCGHAARGLAYRHEPMSLAGVCRHTPGIGVSVLSFPVYGSL